jgi:hypothetical protein
LPDCFRVITAIAKYAGRAMAWPPSFALQVRNSVNKREGLLGIVAIGAAEARSGTRGRRPFGLDLSGGKRGAIKFHKSSEIRAATMARHLCLAEDLKVLLCVDPCSKVTSLGYFRLPEASPR